MTRSNLHIRLSDGAIVHCVADSSSAPEQGWIVETLILPLMEMNDATKELTLLEHFCAMHELRVNADYRYILNLQTKSLHFFEEGYDYPTDKFLLGSDLTKRLLDYIDSTETLRDIFDQLNIKTDRT